MPVSNKLSRIDIAKAARRGVPELRPYIPGKPLVEVKEELGLTEVVKLASNECPLELPGLVLETILKQATDLTRYPDGNCRILGRELASRLGLQTDCLLFGNGAEECIRLVAQAFLNQGDQAIIPKPIFDAYETATILCGAEPVMVPLIGYDIDLKSISAKVTEKTKLIWLCNPANPTATVFNKEAFDRFLAELPENIVVVLDEAYYEFVTDKNCPHTEHYLFKDDRVIGLRTFSKAYGLAGLRVGYIMAHPEVIKLIAKVKLPFNVNVAAQAAALALLREENFAKGHVELICRERERVARSLAENGLKSPVSQTNFLFVRLPGSGDEVFRELMPKGFIVRPGSIFGMPDHIRLSLGSEDQNDGFLKALDEALN
ncbi:histidinol-phosphate transaminase [Dethiosulfatarculus sandiegensis]|uniref:histidinol-phosphate transaminase n=1 Tax=Dethiosulfatarculus sandiegensis TaxID=1429043 RepID=UPI000698789A|nr:histidinol-phosphate transaminase [Dethiosulfatarculus sandiegensis]